MVDVTQVFDTLGRRVSRTEDGVTTIFVPVGQQTIVDYVVGAGSCVLNYGRTFDRIMAV